MAGTYEILREEFDSEARSKGYRPKMLVRVSTDNRFDAVAIYAQMINESPHLHVTLEYKPEANNG